MFCHFCGKQVCVNAGVHWHKWFTKARREGRLWLFHTDFCSCDLCGVAGNEVVGCLVRGETRNWREDTKRITGEENHILWVAAFGIRCAVIDEFDWVGPSCVLSLAGVGKVRNSMFVHNDVFKHGTELTGGAKDGWFVLFG